MHLDTRIRSKATTRVEARLLFRCEWVRNQNRVCKSAPLFDTIKEVEQGWKDSCQGVLDCGMVSDWRHRLTDWPTEHKETPVCVDNLFSSQTILKLVNIPNLRQDFVRLPTLNRFLPPSFKKERPEFVIDMCLWELLAIPENVPNKLSVLDLGAVKSGL